MQGPLSGSSSQSAETARSAHEVDEAEEAGGSADGKANGEADEAGSLEAEARARSGSGAAGPRRRRSSMHAASLRLARHTNRDSATPARR